MENKNAWVTVVMPAYNAAKTIDQAIASVVAQTHTQLELIVINDCSKDDTARIVQEWMKRDSRIRYLCNEKNSGVSISRNRGVQAANYPWIAFLDSDDAWTKDKLNRQMTLVEQNPDALICYTGLEYMDEYGDKYGFIPQVPTKITYRELLKQNMISCSSVLVRTAVIRQYPMHPARNIHEDYATWLQILSNGGYAVGINEPFLIYRISAGSKSGNKAKAALMHWRTLRFMKLAPLSAACYFSCYAVRNLKKYWEIRRSKDGDTVAAR